MLGQLEGTYRIIGTLLYGAGLRLLECLRLRVKDVDLERLQITVRRGKGAKDRVTVLPRGVLPALRAELERVRDQHRADLRRGAGRVALPHAIARKYPGAASEWPWQWVFPASSTYKDAATGEIRRHHLHESAVQRAGLLARSGCYAAARAAYRPSRGSVGRAKCP